MSRAFGAPGGAGTVSSCNEHSVTVYSWRAGNKRLRRIACAAHTARAELRNFRLFEPPHAPLIVTACCCALASSADAGGSAQRRSASNGEKHGKTPRRAPLLAGGMTCNSARIRRDRQQTMAGGDKAPGVSGVCRCAQAVKEATPSAPFSWQRRQRRSGSHGWRCSSYLFAYSAKHGAKTHAPRTAWRHVPPVHSNAHR